MTFNVSMRKLAPMDGEKPKYVAQIKDESGKLQHEVIFKDLNGDGKFTKDEICEVVEYSSDKRTRYINENAEKTGNYNVIIEERKSGNQWVQSKMAKDSKDNPTFKDANLADKAKDVDADKNPTLLKNQNGMFVFLQTLKENLFAKYFDENKDGVLADNELVTIIEKRTEEFGGQTIPIKEIIGGEKGFATTKDVVNQNDQTNFEPPQRLKGNEKMIDILNKKLEADE